MSAAFDPEAAQDRITDWLTEVGGHEVWLKEQLSDTKHRFGSCENCLRQADRLKKQLENQSNDLPTQQQFELVEALKNDFGKAVSKLQDDMVVNQQSGQSLHQLKQSIQHYMDANQALTTQLDLAQKQKLEQEQQIGQLRDENERLERLRDLLMQQQDSFTQRLSEAKGKDRKIEELTGQIEEMKQQLEMQQTQQMEALEAQSQEKERIEAERQQYASKFESASQDFEAQLLNLKQTIETLNKENEALKEQNGQSDVLKQQMIAKDAELGEIKAGLEAQIADLTNTIAANTASFKSSLDAEQQKYAELEGQFAAKCEELEVLDGNYQNAKKSFGDQKSAFKLRMEQLETELEQEKQAKQEAVNNAEMIAKDTLQSTMKKNNETNARLTRDYKAKIIVLQADLETKENEVDALKVQFDELFQEMEKLKAERAKNETNGTNEEANENDDNKEERSEKNGLDDKMIAADAGAEEANKDLESLKQEKEVLKIKIEELNDSISLKDTQLTELRVKEEQWRAERSRLETQKLEQERFANELQSALQTQQTAAQELKAQVSNSLDATQFAQQQASLGEMKAQLSRKDDEISMLEMKLGHLERLKTSLEAECNLLRSNNVNNGMNNINGMTNGSNTTSMSSSTHNSTSTSTSSSSSSSNGASGSATPLPELTGGVDGNDLKQLFVLNNELRPLDDLVCDISNNWQGGNKTQFFIYDSVSDEMKENNALNGGKSMISVNVWKKHWTTLSRIAKQFGLFKESYSRRVSANASERVGSENDKSEEDSEVIEFLLSLLDQKIVVLNQLTQLHLRKETELSQIMVEAQSRIVTLKRSLDKKTREMTMHLKVKQKMFDEVRNLQNQLNTLSKEYQIVVNELDDMRSGNRDHVDDGY